GENQIKIIKDESEVAREIAVDRESNEIDALNKKNQDVISNMQMNFDQIASQYRDRMNSNQKELKEEHQKEVDQIQRTGIVERSALNKDISEIKREKDDASERYHNRNIPSTRSEAFNNSFQEISSDFDVKAKKLHDVYIDDLEKNKLANNDKTKKELKMVSDYMTETIAQKGEENKKAINLYRKKDRDLIENTQQSVENIQNENSRKIQRNTDTFGYQVENLRKKSQEALDRLKEYYTNKQRDIVTKNQQEVSGIVDEIRNDFFQKLNQLKSNFTDKLEKKDRESIDGQEMYEKKIEEMGHDRLTQNRYMGMLFDEKHKQDMDNMKEAVGQRDREKEQQVKEVRKFYENKINDLTKQHVSQMRRFVGDAKKNLQDTQLDNFNKIKNIEKMKLKEEARLKNNIESQVNGLTASYEDKIERMKNNYETEIDKLKQKIQDSN
ncbi:MAG: hypothetical protein HQK53_11005, partial [Oligoflexia bacterium]|nr:hypothetical protein [Oligoflexia bacterium]